MKKINKTDRYACKHKTSTKRKTALQMPLEADDEEQYQKL